MLLPLICSCKISENDNSPIGSHVLVFLVYPLVMDPYRPQISDYTFSGDPELFFPLGKGTFKETSHLQVQNARKMMENGNITHWNSCFDALGALSKAY